MTLAIEEHRAEWFAAHGDEWHALIAESGIDPLFNGPLWLQLWWRAHAREMGASLHILVVRDGVELVAVLPTYRRTLHLRSLIAVRRVELLGSSFRDARGIFSEYLDAPVRPGYEVAAAQMLAEQLRATRDWSEFVCAGTNTDSWIAHYLVPALGARDAYVRDVERSQSWGVSLREGSSAWRTGLGGPIRRKVIGQRKRLVSPQLVDVSAANVEVVFRLIDRFHAVRWDGAHFVGALGEFYRRFVAARPESLRASVLLHDDRPVSALFDLEVGDRQYNIQSGFESDAVPGVSLGYLHLGYAIEAAAARAVSYYDLLGGGGRQRDYKRDLAQPGVEMRVVQVARATPLQALYRWWDVRESKLLADKKNAAS